MLLLLILLWNPVTTDCRGGIEESVAYQVRGQHVMLLGWTNDDPPSPIYSERAPQQGVTMLPEWPMSTEPFMPGDVVWWELDAVDAAGNISGTCI